MFSIAAQPEKADAAIAAHIRFFLEKAKLHNHLISAIQNKK